MKWVFWGSAGIIAYAYVGYAGWLYLRSRWRPEPVLKGTFLPAISVVMVVRNEEAVLASKLQNLLTMEYPKDCYEMVVVSDGSTDRTAAILQDHAADDSIRVVLNAISQGKAACLNDAMQVVRGEIVVFTDARQMIQPDALRLLAENFSDPTVGCVSGQLVLGDMHSGDAGTGLGLYWTIEKKIRMLESASGSVVGATGALYAVRRENLAPVPAGTILDDVYLPMQVVHQGKRVVFEARAKAWDQPNLGADREFARKVRTLSGNYQLLQLAPWLLRSSNPIRFEFVSHKLVRLFVPFALMTLLLSSFLLLGEPLYKAAFIAQVAFYGLSLLAMLHISGPLARLTDGSYTFVMLNAAALVAFANFVTGRKTAWIR
jgi:biofilm PGA synthesis N-glycosyltransferase PgaC